MDVEYSAVPNCRGSKGNGNYDMFTACLVRDVEVAEAILGIVRGLMSGSASHQQEIAESHGDIYV